MDNEATVDRQTIEQLVYGGPHVRRFTQDSPILPDVWVRFGERPRQATDLLLIPNRSTNAGEVATELHERLKRFRKRRDSPSPAEEKRVRSRIAHLPGVVAACLYFDELLELVLPNTMWWRDQVRDRCADLESDSSYKEFPRPSDDLVEALARDMQFAEGQRVTSSNPTGPTNSLPVAVAWTARLAGAVAMAFNSEPPPELHDGAFVPPPDEGVAGPAGYDHVDLTRAFLGMFSNPLSDDRTFGIHRVSLNRDAIGAVERSSLACKADAARLLFNVSCRKITWAVADSGIESRHPAFHDWRGPRCESRVRKTYDFRALREALSLDNLAENDGSLKAGILDGLKAEEPLFDDETAEEEAQEKRLKELDEQAEEQVRTLSKRLNLGQDVDWALLEPLVQIDQKADMEAPTVDHGTHVAGILGADWPQEDEDTEFQWPDKYHGDTEDTDKLHPLDDRHPRRMVGMCPDINLIDLRVLRNDGRSDEFEVIAALQLIRFLNTRAGYIAVHGINLSLSIEHDVANYACGRTPICDECDQLSASGVTVVAAAGNRGHQRFMLEGNQVVAGYSSISISDPGNAESAITVGATHRYRPHDYGVSYFSSRGPTGDGRRKPDLVAPGEKITAPVGEAGESLKDGTSMAAPHVSGAAAMLMARHTELIGRPQRIKEILCSTATDLGREPYFQGAGMLDILRALQSV